MVKNRNNPFPDHLINTISLGDTVQVLKELPDSSVDVIFADPPYNMQLEGKLQRADGGIFKGVDTAEWDKFDSLETYKEFTKSWLMEAKRVLKKDKSSLWVCGSYQNIYIVGCVLQELSFWIINDIVWSKTNPTPNFLGTKFTNKQETMLWATPTQKTKYRFNYKTMKKLNGGKQMTSVWDIPISSGSERIKTKDGEKLHPTQKPEKLLYNVILSSSQNGDLILDPFMGSGTTGAMAKRLGRNFFGIERNEVYREHALKRIEKEVCVPDDFTNAVFDQKPPKVRFHDLVERGYIDKNEHLYFKQTDLKVEISNQKEICYQNEHYGISKLASLLSNKSANGWDVWFVKRKSQYISLSELRKSFWEKEFNFKIYE